MKSQGLPMQTIVLIILVIVVLAAVLIFFFSGFKKASGGVEEQSAVSTCQAACFKAKALASGFDFSSGVPRTRCNQICGSFKGVNFCRYNVAGAAAGNVDCNKYVGPCVVTDVNGKEVTISCDSNGKCTCTI